MSRFEYKKHKLYRDGKATFVACGEIQYFRLGRDRWEKMLDLLQEANCNCVSTYIPWNWHEIEEGVFDFTGETHPSRDLVSFLELVKEKGLMLSVRPGPFVHAEMKNGGIPEWLTEDHPEILALGPDGKLSTYQSYPPLTYLHPITMGYIKKWFEACVPILSRYDNIISWQVDNETSYSYTFMDGTGLANDYHPTIVKNGWYQKFLKKRFKDISVLNERYRSRYSSFEKVAPPRKSPKNNPETLQVYDWIHFKEWLGTQYLKKCCDMMYKFGAEGPFVLNAPFHGFFSLWKELIKTFRNRKYQVIVTHCDYPGPVNEASVGEIISRTEFCKSCQDIFHGNNEIQSCNISQRWGLFETTYELLFKLVVGNGLNMINYYWFCDGENFQDYGEYSNRHENWAPVSHDLNKRPHFDIMKKLNATFVSHPEWMEYKKVYHVSLGYLHQYHRMSILQNTICVNTIRRLDDLANLLALSSISFKIVDLNDLTKEDTGVMIVPTPCFMPPKIQRALLKYAKAGNHLILVGEIPTLDENLRPSAVLAKSLNLKKMSRINKRKGWQEPHRITLLDIQMPIYGNIQTYEGAFESIGECGGQNCAFTQSYGDGKVTVIGFQISYFMDLHKEVICKLLGRHHETDLIHWERRNGKNSLYTFLNIYSEPRTAVVNGKKIKVAQKTGAFVHVDRNCTEVFR